MNRKAVHKDFGEKSIKKRKRIFWLILIILFLIVFFAIIMQMCQTPKKDTGIRCGICGAVNIPAVYDMPEDADLGMLIYKANGLKEHADISAIDYNKVLMHDTIYHIPSKGIGTDANIQQLRSESFLKTSWKESYSRLAANTEEEGMYSEPEQINILYIGLPAVYILINYFPEHNRVSLTHIPHSSAFLANNYRLIDLFFTLGIGPTRAVLQRQLEVRIDHYIIQEKSSFINMIDMMNGVELTIDKPFAEQYDLASGNGTLNGFYTWEYIRFLDFKRIKREFTGYKQQDMTRKDVFKVKPDDWINSYILRHQRQRYVIAGMRKSFLTLPANKQLKTLKKIKESIETDMKLELITSMYKSMLSSSDFSYGRIPGKYRSEGDNLYFFPDEPSFKAMRKKEIRKMIQHREKKQIAY